MQNFFQISILLGALFFSAPAVFAAIPDSLGYTFPLSDSLAPPDTLLELNAGPYIESHPRFAAPAKNPRHEEDQVADPHIKVIRLRMPDPQRATILSAVLPGLGQAYNGRSWKIPIIYGVGYGLYYYYSDYENKFQNARVLIGRVENGEDVGYDLNTLELARDYYAKVRNYCVIGIGILYLANIVDAMTDAYFKQYDISDDLSLRVSPVVMSEPGFAHNNVGMSYGLSLNFRLK